LDKLLEGFKVIPETARRIQTDRGVYLKKLLGGYMVIAAFM